MSMLTSIMSSVVNTWWSVVWIHVDVVVYSDWCIDDSDVLVQYECSVEYSDDDMTDRWSMCITAVVVWCRW